MIGFSDGISPRTELLCWVFFWPTSAEGSTPDSRENSLWFSVMVTNYNIRRPIRKIITILSCSKSNSIFHYLKQITAPNNTFSNIERTAAAVAVRYIKILLGKTIPSNLQTRQKKNYFLAPGLYSRHYYYTDIKFSFLSFFTSLCVYF